MKKTATATATAQAQVFTINLLIEQGLNKRNIQIVSNEDMKKVSAILSAKFNTIKALFGTAKNKYFDATKEAPIMFNLSLNNGVTNIDIKGNINSNNAKDIILELNSYCAVKLLSAPSIDYLDIELAKIEDKHSIREAKKDNTTPVLIAPKLERAMKYPRVELSNIFVS
jgi:hypothetical protein